EVLHAADLLGLASDGFQGVDGPRASLSGRKRLHGRRALCLVCLQQRQDFRIELVPDHRGLDFFETSSVAGYGVPWARRVNSGCRSPAIALGLRIQLKCAENYIDFDRI